MTPEALEALVRSHGLWLMFPLALVEGPIITVIGGALAKAGVLPVAGVYLVAVLGDLVGDAAMYGLGRLAPWLPEGLRRRLGLSPARLDRLAAHFREKGAVTLVIGKLTHSAGFAVLVAAGAAQMPFGRFLAINLAATLPKVAAFLLLGYGLGAVTAGVDDAILVGSLVLLALLGLAWVAYRLLRRKAPS
jgi:membrane protein DedA with SNARE-associated domain